MASRKIPGHVASLKELKRWFKTLGPEEKKSMGRVFNERRDEFRRRESGPLGMDGRNDDWIYDHLHCHLCGRKRQAVCWLDENNVIQKGEPWELQCRCLPLLWASGVGVPCGYANISPVLAITIGSLFLVDGEWFTKPLTHDEIQNVETLETKSIEQDFLKYRALSRHEFTTKAGA